MSDITQGILRHALTMVGGVLVSAGYIDQSSMQLAVGALVTLAGVGWSVFEKRSRS